MVNKALQEEVVEIMNKRKCGSEFISTIGLSASYWLGLYFYSWRGPPMSRRYLCIQRPWADRSPWPFFDDGGINDGKECRYGS